MIPYVVFLKLKCTWSKFLAFLVTFITLFRIFHSKICIIWSKWILYCKSQCTPLNTCARFCTNMAGILVLFRIIIFFRSKVVTFERIIHWTMLELNIWLHLILLTNQAEGIYLIVQNRNELFLVFQTHLDTHQIMKYRLFFIFFLAFFSLIFLIYNPLIDICLIEWFHS